MADRLTVGLVGCGRWGRHILRDLVSLGCDVPVATKSAESRKYASEGGASMIVDGHEQLPELDGVVVATPSDTHASVIEAVLERGIPVYSEKPLTCDAASAARLASAAPERLFVMDKWRYHPGVEMLARIAREKELGPVLGLRTTRVQWGNPHSDVDTSWIFAPHDLSIALEVLGSVPPALSAVAEVLDGRVTGLVGLLGEDPWLALEVSSRFKEHRREIRLHCRDGVAILNDGYSEHLSVLRDEGGRSLKEPEPELRPIEGELPLLRELRAFVEHLKGGPPPRSSAAEGALIVRRIAELRALAGLDKGELT